MNIFNYEWQNARPQSKIRYQCGYCGTDTTPSWGWNTQEIVGNKGSVLICTYCNKPSFVITYYGCIVQLTPSPKFGNAVEGLPSDVHSLFEEARLCTSCNAFTSAVLTCRKILMHVAVEKGAEKGKSFKNYVDFLVDNQLVSSDMSAWVDNIRIKSNEANHEIDVMSFGDAENLIIFTEMLLKIVYEFPHRLKESNKSDN